MMWIMIVVKVDWYTIDQIVIQSVEITKRLLSTILV